MAAQADAEARTSGAKPGKLRWLLGWIILPGSLVAALFLTGVHLGARNPDRPLARLLLKVTGAEPGVAANTAAGAGERGPRPGAEPGEPFEYSATLTGEQLQTIADKLLAPSVAELACEDVCRAWAKRDDAAIYSIEHCQLGRSVSTAPSLLVCRGKLEAEKTEPEPARK